MAKVRVAAWQTAYRGILPDELLDCMTYQAASERWRRIFFEDRSPGVEVFVAENEAKEIIGYYILRSGSKAATPISAARSTPFMYIPYFSVAGSVAEWSQLPPGI